MKYSKVKLAEYCDYSPGDITSTGADWTLFGDGRVACAASTTWQGSWDGARWTTEPGAIDIEDIDEDNEDNDALARLTSFANDIEGDYDREMRLIRKGRLLQ